MSPRGDGNQVACGSGLVVILKVRIVLDVMITVFVPCVEGLITIPNIF